MGALHLFFIPTGNSSQDLAASSELLSLSCQISFFKAQHLPQQWHSQASNTFLCVYALFINETSGGS